MFISFAKRFSIFKNLVYFLPSSRLVIPVSSVSCRYLKKPSFPPLNEDEIRELFAKGSGPGGQKLNKATNRCQLKHLPTGIIVTSHHTRSLEENRKIARRLLQEKLDLYHNKDSSYLAQLEVEKRKQKEQKSQKSIENLKRKKEFKERELESSE